VQRTKETQMRKFWRWVSALQKGEQFVNRISGRDWNCLVDRGFGICCGICRDFRQRTAHQTHTCSMLLFNQPTKLSLLQGQQTPDFLALFVQMRPCRPLYIFSPPFLQQKNFTGKKDKASDSPTSSHSDGYYNRAPQSPYSATGCPLDKRAI